MKKSSKMLVMLKPAILILISIILCVMNFYLGVVADIGSLDLVKAWNTPSLSHYMITLREAMFDFDSFLGHFYENLLSSMITASQILYVIDRKRINENSNGFDRNRIELWKNSRLFAIILVSICGLMLIFAIIGSLLDLGYARPYLANRTFDLMFENFYPQRFSEVFFVYLLLFSGFPLLLFSLGRDISIPQSGRELKNESVLSKISKTLYSVSYFIVILFILIFPVDRISLANGNSVLAMIYSVIAMFLSLGIIEIIIILRDKRTEENTTEGSVISANSNKNTITIKLAVGLLVAVVLGGYAFLILQNPPFLQIGVVRFLQYLPSILFRTCLTIGIVLFSLSLSKIKEVRK